MYLVFPQLNTQLDRFCPDYQKARHVEGKQVMFQTLQHLELSLVNLELLYVHPVILNDPCKLT